MSDSMPRACDTHIGAEEYLSPQWPSCFFFFFRAYTSLPHYGFGFYLFRQIPSYPETFLASVNRVGALNRYTYTYMKCVLLTACVSHYCSFICYDTQKINRACHKYSYARHAHDSAAP